MNDRSLDVRATFYKEVVRHWISSMELSSLRQYDPTFVLFLLNGATDENPEIAQTCVLLLEDHGRAMRDALAQLGEDLHMEN